MAGTLINILLVEDNPADAGVVKEALAEFREEQPFNLILVDRLTKGLKCLAENRVDVILLDLNLPDSGGWDTFEQVHAEAQQIPIIVVAGTEDVNLSGKAVQSGAEDYLVKGQLDGRLLGRSIRHALRRKREGDALRLMSETQRQITRLETEADIYRLVGEKVQELIGGGYTVITILDEEKQAMKVSGLYGFGSLYKNLVRTLKVDPSQYVYPLKDMRSDELRQFRSGKLEIFEGGLYHLLTRKVPKRICEAAERRLRLTSIHTMGFTMHGKHFGGLTILAQGDIALYKEMIENIANQATVSIHHIRAEQALRESESRYRSLFENSVMGISQTLPDGRLIRVNNAYAKMYGYPNPETMMAEVANVGAQLYANPNERKEILRVLKEKEVMDPREINVLRRDGTPFTVLVGSREIRDSEGKPLYYQAEHIDITERKEAEVSLRNLFLRHQALLAALPEIVMEVDQNKAYTWANQAGIGFYGEDVIGREAADYFEGQQDTYQTVQVLFEGKEEITYVESWQRRKDGQKRLLAWWCKALKDENGKTNGVLSTARDITERRQMEETLRKSEESFRNVFENATVGLYRTTPDGRILLANPTLLQMLGYRSFEELSQRNLESDGFEPQYPRSEFRQRIETEGGVRGLETAWKRNDGAIVYMRESAKLVRDADGKVLYYEGTVEDITERKLAEQALARQTDELRQRNEELGRLYRASGALLSGTFELSALAKTIAEVVQHEFGQANCSVFMVQENTHELSRLAVVGPYAVEDIRSQLTLDSPGLVPQAIQTGQLINVPNIRGIEAYATGWESAQAELTVPLLIGSRVIGAIDIQSTQPGAFKPEDEHLMSVFAERAALALEHARLYEQTHRRLQDLVSLRTIDMAISSSFDIRLTLDILLGQLTKRLDVHAADILSFSRGTNTFRYISGQGFRTDALRSTIFRLGDSCAGQACRERRLVIAQELDGKTDNSQAQVAFSSEGFVAYMGMPLIAKGQTKGVLEVFHREPLKPDQEQIAFLELLAGQAAIALDNAELFEELQRSNSELRMAYDETIEGWSEATDLRDHETEGHTRRAAEITVRLAGSMGIGPEELLHIRRGALLHDIGKMGVPDSILHKPGKLNEEEWMIMKQHPQSAYELLSPITYFQKALDIPYCHHEKWDGSGYPRGLKGDEIPLAARIFAVVDAWDALNTARPYRKAWPKTKVFEYLQKQAGKHFDPMAVQAFLAMMQK